MLFMLALFAARGDQLFPFLSSSSYSLPSFAKLPRKTKGLWTLKKIPLFLFKRVHTLDDAATTSASEYILGGLGRRDESEEDQAEPPSPLQCSVKAKITGSEPTLLNMLDYEILPLGQYKYKTMGFNPRFYEGAAFLPINKEGFVMILLYRGAFWALTSAQMKWKQLKNIPKAVCTDLVTFRGKFYVSFSSLYLRTIVSIDPYSLDVALLTPSQGLDRRNYLVPSGNDELFLVEKLTSSSLRVSRLDKEAGKWVQVTSLGHRVLFINHPHLGNVSCSSKELPDGCCFSGNSIVFTNEKGGVEYAFKYEHYSGSLSHRLMILSESPVVMFSVEHDY